MSAVNFFKKFLPVLLIFSFLSWWMIKDWNKGKQIREKHIVLCAEISYLSYTRGGYSISYYYYYKGKTYSSYGMCDTGTKRNYDRGKLHVFIAVDSNDIGSSVLLENDKDFSYYQITKEDTAGLKCYE